MWSQKERYMVKRDSKMKKPLNGLQCVKNICRQKIKDLINKKRKKGVVGYGGTHL